MASTWSVLLAACDPHGADSELNRRVGPLRAGWTFESATGDIRTGVRDCSDVHDLESAAAFEEAFTADIGDETGRMLVSFELPGLGAMSEVETHYVNGVQHGP